MSWVHPTVTASTMIARFNFGRKVRCHNIAVEKIGGERTRGSLRALGDNLATWLTILMRARALQNLLDRTRCSCLLSSSGSSSAYYPSA